MNRTASAIRARIDAVIASGEAWRDGWQPRRFVCRLCDHERRASRVPRSGVCEVCRAAMRNLALKVRQRRPPRDEGRVRSFSARLDIVIDDR